jgi:hypothetical protein
VDGGPHGGRTTVPVAGSDTISELRLQLSNKSWFTSKHCLFFGDRELLDHQQVSDIVSSVHSSGNNSYLHVFVRTPDVHFGQLSTGKASLSFGSLAEMDGASSTHTEPSCPCVLLDQHSNLSDTKDLVSCANSADPTIIHVVIRKTAHVTWQPTTNGMFELLVRASDTAADVKQQLLPSTDPGIPGILEDVALVHKGVRMEADRPLIEYGLSDGDELELVPWEPTVSRQPDAKGAPKVPDLQSPTHELFLNWQKAADGLRAGVSLSELQHTNFCVLLMSIYLLLLPVYFTACLGIKVNARCMDEFWLAGVKTSEFKECW